MTKASISRTYLKRTIAVAACALALLGGFWINSEYRHFTERSEELRREIMDTKKQEIADRADEAADYIEFLRSRTRGRARLTLRRQVDLAIKVAQAIFDSTPDKTQAAKIIRKTLRDIHFFDGAGYYFAYDSGGTLMLHAELTSREGQSLLEFQDPRGKFVIKDLLRVAREQGEGFSQYQWTKPGEVGDDHEKLAYVKYFKPLKWVIGSGLYIEDVTAEIQIEAMEWLNSKGFDDSGYLFAWRYDGTALVGPYVGRNFKLSTNPEEHEPFMQALAVAQKGGGFVTYHRPSTVNENVYEKLSYVRGIEDWSWFVGSGFSTKGVADTINRVNTRLTKRIVTITLTIAGVIACFIAAAYIGLRVATAGVKHDFAVFTKFFTQAAEDTDPIDTEHLTFVEFMRAAEAANHMQRERNRARRELKNSEARYRNIFESMTDGYFRTDLQGHISILSPSALRLLDLPPDQNLDELNAKIFYQTTDDRDAFLNKLLRDEAYDGFICPLKRMDGACVEMEVNARLIRDEETGAPVAVEGMFRDITDRRRTQEILVQSEKMQSVAGLAAGMAHEINNPLGGILQGIQNIERRLASDLPANVKAAEATGCDLERLGDYLRARRIPDTLEGIRDMGERAARIVARMQTFSRRSESRRVWTRMEELVNSAVDLAYSDYDLKKKYSFRSIDIVRDFDLGLPKVSCTETEIQQVILNLLTNAAQAMALAENPPATPRITLRTRREDDYAVLDVMDNGPGMDEPTRLRVFQPFFTTREPGLGVGLGLSNAYFIVTAHHDGTIRVESEPGKGATFSLLLPVSEPSRDT